MPSIRSFTPPIDQETDSPVKLQVWVSQRDKRTILAAVGDDGVFTFVIRTQFQRLAEFIRTNDLTSYDNPDASLTRIVQFVRNGTDTRPDRPAATQHDTRAATRLQHKNASASSVASGTGSGSASGGRSVKVGKVKGKQGS